MTAYQVLIADAALDDLEDVFCYLYGAGYPDQAASIVDGRRDMMDFLERHLLR
ncbi:MAG: hypothetical protein ACOVKO_02775 [Elstera sp.]|jgi:hypothetical protein